MAGHSQFKNIMHRKGRQDAQKSKLFGKLAREITVAAKLGTPDPAMNPRLRAADDRGAAGKHAQGQYRARHQEGDRRRRRELRRNPLRGLRPGRRRRHRRGADRQPQPRRLRHPLLLHQVRRQSRRNRLGRLHVRPHRHHRIRRQRRLRRRDAGCRDRGRRRRRDLGRKRPRDLRLAGDLPRGRQGAGSEVRRGAQVGADLEAAEHDRGRRRDRREAVEADRPARTSTTTCRTSTPISRCRTR